MDRSLPGDDAGAPRGGGVAGGATFGPVEKVNHRFVICAGRNPGAQSPVVSETGSQARQPALPVAPALRWKLGRVWGWAIAYTIAGLIGSLISVAVFDYYDPIRWPIVLLPRLALFLPALGPLALVHALHLRGRVGLGPALAMPTAGLGGAVALIAACAFSLGMIVNWRQPHWVSILPQNLRYAASIPGPLAVIGGTWFGLVEVVVLRRAARPGGWVLLLLPASTVCATAILMAHFFAMRWDRTPGWVAAALLSLPLAGAAYGALAEAVLRPDTAVVPAHRPDRALGAGDGKRLFARWLIWHLVTALIGGLATMFAAFPVFEQFGDDIARTNASIAVHPSVLLPLAAAPIAAYQAWALRKAILPVLWLGLVLLVGLPPTPYLLLFVLSVYLSIAGPQGSWISFLAELVIVGMFWTGLVLALPMLAVTSFWRWMAQGGVALGIGAVAVYLGWGFAVQIGWWTWPAGIFVASLVFALFTHSVVRPALALAYPPPPRPAPSPAGA